MSKNIVITIMAAGEGKRMNSSLPKVLHKFNDIPMLVRIIIESLIISNKIIIITGKYDELIKKTINEYILDELELEKLQYVQQQNSCGTGDAIKSTLVLLLSLFSLFLLIEIIKFILFSNSRHSKLCCLPFSFTIVFNHI